MTMRNNLVPSGLVAITPSDSAFVNIVGVLVGGAGNVNLVDSLGVTTLVAAIAGQHIPGVFVQVKSASTTATGLVGLVA